MTKRRDIPRVLRFASLQNEVCSVPCRFLIPTLLLVFTSVAPAVAWGPVETSVAPNGTSAQPKPSSPQSNWASSSGSADSATCSQSRALIATVNGQNITCATYFDKLSSSPQALGALNQLVQSIMIKQYARTHGITVTNAAVTNREGAIRRRYPPGQFDKILASQHLPEVDVRRILWDQLVVERAGGPGDANITAFLQRLRSGGKVVILDDRFRDIAGFLMPTGRCFIGSARYVVSVDGEFVSCRGLLAKMMVTPQGLATFRQDVQQILINQYARDNGVWVSASAIDGRLRDIRSRYSSGQFERILKAQRMTYEDVRGILRQQIIIERAVAPRLRISDVDVRAYFDKNHQKLDMPERVRVRHILVANLETANALVSRLNDGADFETLARDYSTDPSTREKGGELGFFSRTQMVPEFSAAAFSQEIGVIGPPVKTPFGYHIIEVEEKRDGSVATLESSRAKIVETLTQQEQNRLIPLFLRQLRSRANVKVLDSHLRSAV